MKFRPTNQGLSAGIRSEVCTSDLEQWHPTQGEGRGGNLSGQRVPWLWMAAIALPAGMGAFVGKCSDMAVVFTLKKFIQDPQAIVALTSVNILFGVLVAPIVAWKSDRVVTPLGRRKPFMLPGLALLAISLVLLPQAPSLGWVIAVLVLYQFSMDFSFTGLWNPLYADLVPNEQRGRGMVINRVMVMGCRVLFMLFLIGQFDKHYHLANGWGIRGEQVIYYVGALLVVLSMLCLMIFVREPVVSRPGEPRPASERFHLRTYLQNLFSAIHLRRLYLLVIASTLMSIRLGPLQALLLTDQFGFSKQVMGNMHGTCMFVNCLIILPLGAILVDRISRWWLFGFCLLCSTLQPIAFWGYVHVTGIPDPWVMIAFHVFDTASDHMALIALWPLVFERLSARVRGTAQAGFMVVGGITSFVLMNAMGAWVKGYSRLFMPDGQYDYMSGYLLIFVIGLVACNLVVISAIGTWRDRTNALIFDGATGEDALQLA